MTERDAPSPESLFADWLAAHERGETPDFEELCATRPERAADLRALHAEWRRDDDVRTSHDSRWEPFLQQLRARGPAHTRYEVEGEVARGGMGVVQRVYDRDVRRALAMKISLDQADAPASGEAPATDDRSLGQFLEEAQVTGQLEHPGIVPVHEVGVDGAGRVYFTMQLVEGEDLRAIFDRVHDPIDAEWTPTRALNAMLRVCEAMAYAHTKGVVHRDLKPANVMVGRFGEVYVMDWGLARVVSCSTASADGATADGVVTERALHLTDEPDSSLASLRGGVAGTPEYMPPEQAEGDLDRLGPAADVYAVGAMLYHLLSGAPPYADLEPPRDAWQKVKRVLEGPPAPLVDRAPRAPAELLAIIDKAMERDPTDRYLDMTALARDLRAYLEDRVVSAHRTGPWVELKKWVKRNRSLAWTAAAALVTVAALGTWSNLRIRSERNAALENESEAKRQKTAAEAERDRVLRLSDKRRLDDLIAEADALWPEHPSRLAELRDWLERAESLLARLPVHEETLARVRKRGTRTSSDDVADGSLEYDFDKDVDLAWWHDAVRDLVLGLHALSENDVHGPTVAGIRSRVAWAETIEERTVTGPEVAAMWADARAAILVHPKYGGLDLKPQLGLVPIGPDPDSTLWEFGHPRTGKVPVRDMRTGKFEMTEETGLVFVLIPGGTYRIGAQREDPDSPHYDPQAEVDEAPVHDVTLSPYMLSKFEMTQRQWAGFTGTNPSNYPPSSNFVLSLQHPVENVSWAACQSTLSRVTLVLPTEAQWEAACRAETEAPWSTGFERESLVGAANLADQAAKRSGAEWPDIEDWPALEDGFVLHAPVGSYRANPFGLHDMHGNIWEWCRDAHSSSAYEDVTPHEGDGLREIPNATIRVDRGGCFDDRAASARSSKRYAGAPEYRHTILGLRPSRPLD